MSTHWDVYCRTCNERLGLQLNHAEDTMLELIRMAPELAKIAPLRESITDWRLTLKLDTPNNEVDFAWFRKHLGHDLAPLDEYGRFLDRCSERVNCPHCDSRQWCVLPAKHDGEHSVAKPRFSEPVQLPDGSGFFTASLPLPKSHWLYADGVNESPMPMRTGVGAKRNELADQITAAARHAIRASTRNGKEPDFDPDAMVQNMVVGLLGYWTDTGHSNR